MFLRRFERYLLNVTATYAILNNCSDVFQRIEIFIPIFHWVGIELRRLIGFKLFLLVRIKMPTNLTILFGPTFEATVAYKLVETVVETDEAIN